MADANGTQPKFALMLQGGGALGAYQVGAYAALAETQFAPEWVAGISIGAINAAIIAGNALPERVAKLDALWKAIDWPDLWTPPSLGIVHDMAATMESFLVGQPGFFSPRLFNPSLFGLASPDQVSFYDTAPMRETLRRYAHFPITGRDPDGGKGVRLSLGVTNVESGELETLDTAGTNGGFGPEHVIASGSLPPGFPATRIGDSYYWDGGCVSNSPLEMILDGKLEGHWVVVLIDLWPRTGPAPETISAALWRAKQIQYASRTSHHVEAIATKLHLRHAIKLAKDRDAPGVQAVPDDKLLKDGRVDIIHAIYDPVESENPFGDAEFSRGTIAKRRQAGYDDMKAILAQQPWLHPQTPAHLGALVHRAKGGTIHTFPEPFL